MNVLIADDDPGTVELLQNALEQLGYQVSTATNGLDAYRQVKTGQYRMLITDWQMPGMTGLELCELIRKHSAGEYIYIIMLTSYTKLDGVVCCLEAGADDYLCKPCRPAELLVRVRAGERVLTLESRELTIFAMAKLVESRDNETGGHLERMREYARLLAEELSHTPAFESEVDGRYINLLYLTTPLHDIGKVAIPDGILRKPGKLTPEEFAVMKTHTTIGSQTLADVTEHHHSAAYMSMARDIALTHHERYDGSGYPYGLKGQEIPLCGRITALADVYDALTSRRTYKPAFSHEDARQIILDSSGSHFDPQIVDAFVRCEAKFIRVQQRHQQLEYDGLLRTHANWEIDNNSTPATRETVSVRGSGPVCQAVGTL
ncbi:MAG: HD domain-containing phosphohydrolase [Planctomycetaceae bacterium]